MGCYNSILAKCKECGKTIEFQTKSGSCCQSEFNINDAPLQELQGVEGDLLTCECGTNNKIVVREKIMHKARII